MKKALSNMPNVKLWYHYFKNGLYRMKYKGFSVGYATEINHSTFGQFNSIGSNVNLLRVDVGSFSYISDDCFLRDVTLGKFCSVASGVKIGLGYHPTHFVSCHPVFYSNENQVSICFAESMKWVDHQNVRIGNDVWIGTNAVILDGVTIGNGAIIGAGSIVTSDVKDYEVVAGVPAKHIKFRFTEEQIEKFNQIKWWNWEIEKLKADSSLFLNVPEFLTKFEHGANKI
jgi:acetyltransferase-like isoleucine patch superfamily enzyme